MNVFGTSYQMKTVQLKPQAQLRLWLPLVINQQIQGGQLEKDKVLMDKKNQRVTLTPQ